MHIVEMIPDPDDQDRDEIRKYIMSQAFCHAPAAFTVLNRREFKHPEDLEAIEKIRSVHGVIHVRSTLRDITLQGVDTVIVRIDQSVGWEAVEPELHRVLKNLKPVDFSNGEPS